jgi:cytochrome b561
MADPTLAEPQQPVRRYSNFAVFFHWTTVILVLTQAYLGFTFANMERGPARLEIFTWHKTVGALILLLTLVRLAYRLVNPPPPYPTELPRWERVAGTWNHRIFYALLILMPLSGLTAVSAHTTGAFTRLASGIPLPVIPGVSKHVGGIAGDLHGICVVLLLLAIAIHVAAALKHQFVDHSPAADRMPPFKIPGDRAPVIGQGHRAHPLHF